ncbi:MAG: glycoside hydrolase family 3 N-terminal domain-containing protein [Anaerolineaceae bacterium]|nr:glycoside hydrolase family 3 N-terminal domain-containing protein [Anaerolineaceae bacterium]
MNARLSRLLLCLFIILGLSGLPINAGSAQEVSQAEALLARMTPSEKVGQLFLITFDGSEILETSSIVDLISNYHVGGVVLSADHNNFVDNSSDAWQLIQTLQEINWQKSNPLDTGAPANPDNTYIPLYIGMNLVKENNRTPQLLSGLTQYPSPMSIGATWSTELAQEVGNLVGLELSALGVNLLLGPSLDVVDSKDLVAAAYVGTQSFGGDPYWVGEMGMAYVEGVHLGSQGRMSVIAQHFPGLGSVDRPPNEEVSTVQKTLEQLKQIELAPYMSVVGDPNPQRQVDGLMISAIRFQGLQGNIRATTMPVNFDQNALTQLLSPEPLATWRANGGLTISDSLGSPAVKLVFSSGEDEFDPLTVARTAFLAGNDMLFLDNFKGPNDLNQAETIARTIEFFRQKYQEDAVFAQRVDASVLRILQAKMQLYPAFDLESVTTPQEGLALLGQAGTLELKVNREAVTLLAPSPEFLNASVAQPPALSDYITIFTDTRLRRQCDSCLQQYGFNTMDFENTLTRYYGPNGTNQLMGDRIFSYSFTQLHEILDQRTEPADPNRVDNLRRSQWVVINLLNEDPALPETRAFKRLLSERLDLLRDKNVIVFSYDVPYYLDSTDLANISAYYVLYNNSQSALDIAARVLMRETTASGSLPVSISAVDYQLGTITAPNPNQVIQIKLLTPAQAEVIATAEMPTVETPVPLFVMGENVRIQAGPIVDHNGNQVPDGTVVKFTIRLSTENLIISQPETVTQDGLATIDYRIEREGIFEVSALSEPAMTSGRLILNTQGGLAQVIMPTETPTPTATPTLMPTPTPTLMPTPTPDPSMNLTGYPRLTDWLLVILLNLAGGFLAWIAGYKWWGSVRWGFRSAMCTVIGGLAAYLLLTLGITPIMDLVKESSSWFVAQVTVIGMLFGWAVALAWWMINENDHPFPPK